MKNLCSQYLPKEFDFIKIEMKYIKDEEQEKVIHLFFANKVSYEAIPEIFRNDKNFILELVSKFGLIFEKIAPCYKEDKEIILTALKNNADVVKMLSDQKVYNKEFVKEILDVNACCISRLPDAIAYDFEILSKIDMFLKKHNAIYPSYWEYWERCRREMILSDKIDEKEILKKEKKKI